MEYVPICSKKLITTPGYVTTANTIPVIAP